jgi:hypothetical protein
MHTIVKIDFAGREDLLTKLKEVARREERSLQSQIIYWLRNHIGDYIGFDKKRRGGN